VNHDAVGILARRGLTEAGPALRDLVAWLRARDLAVLLEEDTALLLEDVSGCDTMRGSDLARRADALVVLGGDGTLLGASRLLGERCPPILGVNFGSLGFLTEISLGELYPALESVLTGDYAFDERKLLHAVVHRNGEEQASADVLNDVVVTRAALSRIVELEIAIDGRFVSSFRADGLIVSSTTGSTAYNLAAGGPILHPSLSAVVLTPICPHTLTHRPLVVGDDLAIEVRVCDTREVEVHLSFDGQDGRPLTSEDTVTITRSARRLRLVHAPTRDYFEVLRTKLRWGEPTARRR
jgi:NAD+ kinase